MNEPLQTLSLEARDGPADEDTDSDTDSDKDIGKGRSGSGREALAEDPTGRNNLLQLIQLRWLAVGGQLATILSVEFLLGAKLPLLEMLVLLAMLSLFNLASWWRSRASTEGIAKLGPDLSPDSGPELNPNVIRNGELFIGLLVDVAVLTAQLHYSGGITNPFIFLFLLQVAVGAVLLRPRYIWAMVALTSLCFIMLTVWFRPLSLPELASTRFSIHYIGGLLICFTLNAALLVIFIHRISRNLRQRDARLADLRQRAAETEHIVRMGLLASGAAHELGTPLATLSVILGDWSRITPFTQDPDLMAEIKLMQLQLKRCKTIVGGILLSAGEARGEFPVETTLHRFLDELVAEWRSTSPAQSLDYQRADVPDRPIISDSALKQMLGNVLDNAVEAAPNLPVRLRVGCVDDLLTLSVRDQGPGFSLEMLGNFGKPYHSSKGRPGSGLGLFLSVNVARTLGGSIRASNRAGGGAEVVVTLPLAALSSRERTDLEH